MSDEEVKLNREGGFLPETESVPEYREGAETSPDLLVSEDVEHTSAVERVLPPVPVEQTTNHSAETYAEQKDPLFKTVEKALEDQLLPVFMELSASKKELFLVRAKVATQKLRDDIANGKLRRYRTRKIIGDLLGVIPNVDKYWKNQVVKNDVDALEKIQEEQRKAA